MLSNISQISLLSLVAIAAASPMPEPDSDSRLETRSNHKDKFIDPVHPKLSTYEQCTGKPQAVYTSWNVVIPNAKAFTDNTCGSGFLDNINGHSCSVTGWGCHYAKDGKTMNAGFKTAKTCSQGDISKAIKEAFGGRKVECIDYDKDIKCEGNKCKMAKDNNYH